MNLESQLDELKYDYVRLQNDLEKRESLNQNIDPLVIQSATSNLLYSVKIIFCLRFIIERKTTGETLLIIIAYFISHR